MSQSVFDIGSGVAAAKHIDGPGMTEAVSRVDVVQTLWRQHQLKIFFTEPMDAGACECLSTLVDKKPMAIQGSWSSPIFLDVQCDQFAGFRLQSDLAEAVALAQDGRGLVVGIKVVDIQGGDFGGPGAGVKEQMQQAIIPEAFVFL